MAFLLRPSGGLVYHARAIRHRALWAPFRDRLAACLADWPEPAARNFPLLLVGGSGGHTLRTDWLRRFPAVVLLDPDPLARFFFTRNHPAVPVRQIRRDAFRAGGRLDAKVVADWLDDFPGAPVMFANVLGQLLLEGRDDEASWALFLTAFRTVLNGRSWCSYHDLHSDEGRTRTDHLTRGPWTDGLHREEFDWRLTPRRTHRIEVARA